MSIYMYICVCVCACMCVCVCVCMHVCVCVHACVCMFLHACVHVCVYACMCVCMRECDGEVVFLTFCTSPNFSHILFRLSSLSYPHSIPLLKQFSFIIILSHTINSYSCIMPFNTITSNMKYNHVTQCNVF